jgi:phosphoglycerate dehydrogenase-like enzyme
VYTALGLTVSVAEFTIAAILALLKRIKEADSAVRTGNWSARYSELVGTELFSKTVGIVGLGRIGLEVAKRLKPFGVDLVYCDLVRNPEAEREIPITFTPLPTLLKQSDIVSLHVPSTNETFHLISENELVLMKQGALLVNMARGTVIDETALVEAISSGKLAGAALDVFEKEPFTVDNPLSRFPNVLLSPHMSSHTHEALDRTAIDAAEAVIAVLSGKQTRYLANPEVLKRSKTGI